VIVFICRRVGYIGLLIMASDSSGDEFVGSLRWFCHSCDVETEVVTEVSLSRGSAHRTKCYTYYTDDKSGQVSQP